MGSKAAVAAPQPQHGERMSSIWEEMERSFKAEEEARELKQRVAVMEQRIRDLERGMRMAMVAASGLGERPELGFGIRRFLAAYLEESESRGTSMKRRNS